MEVRGNLNTDDGVDLFLSMLTDCGLSAVEPDATLGDWEFWYRKGMAGLPNDLRLGIAAFKSLLAYEQAHPDRCTFDITNN